MPGATAELIARNRSYTRREGFLEAGRQTRQLLIRSIEKSDGDSILLSGGLDTNIIAALASKSNPKPRAFTVVLKDFTSPDLQYSKLISSRLGLGQDVIEAILDDIENSLPEVIGIFRSFDPMEVRNSVAVFLGLRKAKAQGYSRVLTSDAADELFAGYSFVTKLEREKAISTLHHLWEVMHFSSISLASSLGIEALLPFLDDEVKKFATTEIPFEFLVGEQRDQSTGELFGKFILRKAFDNELPPEVVWRKKTPIEFGSGTTFLPKVYASKIDSQEFNEKKRKYLESDKVRFRDPEQLHYYEIFRSALGPPTPDLAKRSCPACTSNVPDSADFCTICGEYPI
jgi:asparagine synthase (glutamine-hydrolysing)